MKATQLLHDLGQSLWLDNITRDLLTSRTLKRYRDELSVTGLTSNPTIFDHAIKNRRRRFGCPAPGRGHGCIRQILE
jgi:transaldolase